MTSCLFRNVLVYQAGPDAAISGPTDVLVSGQRITVIGDNLVTESAPDLTVIEGHSHHLVAPGLINAHFHSPANHLKGSFPSLPLEEFMLYESPSVESLRPSPREAYLRTMLAIVQMLRTGTTFVADDAFLMPSPQTDIIDSVMQAYADSGIRATVALDQPELPETEKLPYIAGFAEPELLSQLQAAAPMPAAELLGMYDHLITRWHGAERGRLSAAVSISAPQRVSPEYFQALDALSATHDLPLFAHMLETKLQRTLSTEQARFGGRSLVRYTHDLGLLSARMNVIHAVWVDDADLDLVAASGASIAHNPISNLRLGSGVMPFRAAAERGIPICLGVDEAICDDAVNMWQVVKMTGLIHNISGLPSDKWPTAQEILASMWTGGATALRRSSELGQVAVGHLADLVLIDLHTLPFTPDNDLLRQLVYCHSGESVVCTMVDGEIVFTDGRLTRIDEAALLAEARELFAATKPLRSKAYQELAPQLPAYRRMTERARTADVGLNRWLGEPG